MMNHQMKAAVLTAPGKAETVQVPLPEPGHGDIVVKIEGCGVCASNIPLWEGRPWFSYPAPPGAPGHEGWGRVQAVGREVRGFKEGDRVTLLSYNAYAEYDRIPAGAAVKLPGSLDGTSFPGESIGCAMNVFGRSDIRDGQNVAVIGTGFLGAIFTALAVAAGARVIAISRRQSALDLAARLGAHHTEVLDDHQRVIESVREAAGESGCDRVLEATGYQWPLDLSGELVAEGGKIMVAGFHQDGPRQVNMQLWNWKGIDVINAHERDSRRYVAGIEAGIEAVAQGAFPLSELLTHHFSLDDLGHAYRTLVERPEGFIKGIVTPKARRTDQSTGPGNELALA